MTKLIVLAATLSLVALTGCQGSQTATESAVSPGMVNARCPQSGGPLREGCPTSSWDGETIGFCCPGCKANFDRKTDDVKDAQLAAMKSAA